MKIRGVEYWKARTRYSRLEHPYPVHLTSACRLLRIVVIHSSYVCTHVEVEINVLITNKFEIYDRFEQSIPFSNRLAVHIFVE